MSTAAALSKFALLPLLVALALTPAAADLPLCDATMCADWVRTRCPFHFFLRLAPIVPAVCPLKNVNLPLVPVVGGLARARIVGSCV